MFTPPDMSIVRKLDFKDPRTILATWFGLGLLSPAPGTWGSLGALPFGLILMAIGGAKALVPAIIIMTLLGLISAAHFEKQTGVHDSKMVVIDEVVGQWIALLPAAFSPLHALVAFALFRLFDIVKPWPISYLDRRVKGALGVMADDVLAGLAAAFCLWGLIYAGII